MTIFGFPENRKRRQQVSDAIGVGVTTMASGLRVLFLDCGAAPPQLKIMTPAEAMSLSCRIFDLALAATIAQEPASAARGVTLIARERARQALEEGWTPEHDDGHVNGELARAGACYALPAGLRRKEIWAAPLIDLLWPFAPDWWKPGHEHPRAYDDRIRELVKAGALIAAEIDRLLRAKARENSTDAQ